MTQDELHEVVMLLREDIASGSVKIPEASSVHASLGNIRFGGDGKIDPNTVNSDVRAAALAASAARTRREMMKVPLREAQVEYFEILEQFFGTPFSEMKEHGVTPAQIAEHMASQESIVRAFEADMDEFESGMREFWDYYGPVVDLHLSQLNCLKSVFGGDIFPAYTANIACSVGLYMDTVVLPDPLLRILALGKAVTSSESLRLLTKHALSAMQYRELALADVNPPIVVIAADPMFREEWYKSGLEAISEKDVVKHASAMFGTSFSDIQDVYKFLAESATVDGIVAKLIEPKRFLFDAEWSGSPAELFSKYIERTTAQIPGALGANLVDATYMAFFGRMMQTNDLLLRSARYSGTPLVDAPTSWQFLLWKYEYDADQKDLPERSLGEAVISRAIATEGGTEFGMLSGVPPDALIELRKNGAMASLRETMRAGLNEIDSASPESLSKVADQVIANIDRTFEEHDRQLKEAGSSRKKFFGFDVGRWIVSGGVSVAAALSHNLGLALVAAAAPRLIGGSSVLELNNKWRELRTHRETLKRSPTAILFRHLGPRFGFTSPK